MPRARKCWSQAVGAHGHTVVACERAPGGLLHVRWWVPGGPNACGQWKWQALRHADKPLAERTARDVAAQLLAQTMASATRSLTVTEAIAFYTDNVARHLKGAGPSEASRRADLWQTFLGGHRDVRSIDFPTIDRFCRERREGRIVLANHKLKLAPSDRALEADLTCLVAVLNHATRCVSADGRRRLLDNPLRGYPKPKSLNPRRPVATYDRFLAIRATADSIDPQRLFGPFLELVETLGWRVSAICQLRAQDVERRSTTACPYGRIFKRPDTDKEGAGGWLPLSVDGRAAADAALGKNPYVGAWPLFPAPRARTSIDAGEIPKACSRYHARGLLERAEKAAHLEPLAGSDFHAYRRAWATSRKHLPAQDVARAGGWRDLRCLQTAYTHSDETTLLAVVTEPRKLRDANGHATNAR